MTQERYKLLLKYFKDAEETIWAFREFWLTICIRNCIQLWRYWLWTYENDPWWAWSLEYSNILSICKFVNRHEDNSCHAGKQLERALPFPVSISTLWWRLPVNISSLATDRSQSFNVYQKIPFSGSLNAFHGLGVQHVATLYSTLPPCTEPPIPPVSATIIPPTSKIATLVW